MNIPDDSFPRLLNRHGLLSSSLLNGWHDPDNLNSSMSKFVLEELIRVTRAATNRRFSWTNPNRGMTDTRVD